MVDANVIGKIFVPNEECDKKRKRGDFSDDNYSLFIPLVLAANDGNTEVVKLLLDSYPNINVNIKDRISGTTALIFAVTRGYKEIVR